MCCPSHFSVVSDIEIHPTQLEILIVLHSCSGRDRWKQTSHQGQKEYTGKVHIYALPWGLLFD